MNEITISKKKLTTDPFAYMLFVSPSGTGLKLLVKVGTNQTEHGKSYTDLSTYYSKRYSIEADKSCKDVGRLMFLSYDPDIYINENSKIWDFDECNKFKFNFALNGLEKKELFQVGNRNNFIFKLSSTCRKQNLDLSFCLNEIKKKYLSNDFSDDEITKTVNSGYNSNGIKPEGLAKDLATESLSLFARVEKYLEIKYDIRLNEVSNKIEYRSKGEKSAYVELNENSIFRELQLNNLPFSFNKLASLLQSDYVPRYNPFKDYFENLGTWSASDKDYILELAEYIPVKDRDRFNKHFKKMLVRCIACCLEETVFNKQVFVLVHDQQNSGKSTFCRWLCPPILKNYLAENINTDKDSLIALTTNFLINMDELATLSKTEINALKSLISKDRVNVRLPFGKRQITIPRRASFIGSTNKDEFLTDETGSVRWLCFILIGNINFAYSKDFEINDIWKEAYALYKSGFLYQLTPSEVEENEISNREFQVASYEMEIIPTLFIPSSKEEDGLFYTATDVLKKISECNYLASTKCNIQSIGRAMKMIGFIKESKYMEGKKFSEKGYYVKII
ncbi:MAG: primase C-terminal domain-containing protein [Chitinophagaceae bacterium]|nr:primase C-terminal domain-containing protein [Chitinophagaceae bacterium]